MKGDPEERAVQIGRYLVQSGATVRAAAQVFALFSLAFFSDSEQFDASLSERSKISAFR